MANRDLINLGISPDSGTGDSARRGGEKINTLFADIYTQMGDNPVGQDPSQPFYGYRRPFFEYEYKVGELHPAGRFIPIEFKTTNSRERIYDSEWGYGYDNTGTIIDTDGDGIPDIYRDSEWYFLSRGEQIDVDLSAVDSDSNVHFVLPLGAPGDQIIIRDGFGTWNNTLLDKGIHVNIWTTPYEFQTVDQILEWERNTEVPGTSLDSETIGVYSPLDGTIFKSNWHKVKNPAEIEALYPKLDQPFAVSRTTDPYDGRSPTFLVNTRRYQLEFLFSNYNEGWVMRQVVLDAADIGSTLLQFGKRIDAIDSDLDRGLYISTDSDIRHTVPLLRRTADGREVHGNLSLRGDEDAIMTTIDSEDTALINDPRSALGGDTVQPLTTTVRFKLRDNVKIKDNLYVGGDASVGETLTVGHGDEVHFTVDSDLVMIDNKLQVHELATFDSDVIIEGQLLVKESSQFDADVRFMRNVWVGGDTTNIQTETLHVRDNLITLSANSDDAPILDTGIIFQRWDRTDGVNTPLVASDSVYNPYMVWNESTDKFVLGETVSSDSEQVLVKDRTYMALGRGEFVLYDSENTPRVWFEKAYGWPDDVRGPGGALLNPNERPTVEPDYEFQVKANAVFGRDSDDVVVFNSRIMSNFIPFGDERYSLGDSDNKWKDLYLAGNTIHLGAVKIKERGGAIYITDSDDNRINLDGAEFSSSSATVDSELSVGGNSSFFGNITVGEHAYFDSDVIVKGNVIVGDDITTSGKVYIRESLTVDSDVFLSADLRVDSDVYIKGDVEIREDLVVIGELNVDDNVYFGHKLTVDSDVVFGSDLRVDSDVTIKGELYVGENAEIHDTLYVKGHVTLDSDVTITGRLNVGNEVTFADDVFFMDHVYMDSDLYVRGNLTVNGTTTYINTTSLEVADNLIVLNKNQASPVNDTGLIFQRYDSDNVSSTNWNATFLWDESLDAFVMAQTSSSGILPNPAIEQTLMRVHETGDVKFFEETGLSVKFHWDASTEHLGLGVENPENPLHIRMDGSTGPVPTSTSYTDFIQLDQYIGDVTTAAAGPSIRFSLKDTNNPEAIARVKGLARNDAVWGDNDEGNMSLVFETTDAGVSSDKFFVTGQGNVAIGQTPTATAAPFFFDMTGASDPAGLNRPTLTGDGTGVIDGGTF